MVQNDYQLHAEEVANCFNNSKYVSHYEKIFVKTSEHLPKSKWYLVDTAGFLKTQEEPVTSFTLFSPGTDIRTPFRPNELWHYIVALKIEAILN